MEGTERNRRFVGAVDHTTADAARALHALSDNDLVRLKALARLWSRGLPGLGWADVLNEAIVRVLDGSRPWPHGVPLLAFLSGVMRSICDDHWRRARREALLRVGDLLVEPCVEGIEGAPDPERVLAAAQALAAIHELFADDPCALTIIAGLAEGLTANEIRRHSGLTERDYDTARRRMRRALLRHGLAGGLR